MSQDTRSLIKIILVLELILLVAGMFFIKNHLSYALGILLGTAVSAARLVLLERALNKSVDMSPTDAQNYTRLQYGLRMIGILAIAFAAIKLPFINVWAFVIGLLPVQPAVYIYGFINSRKKGSDAAR